MRLNGNAAESAVANNAHQAEQPGRTGFMQGTGKPVQASAHGQSCANQMSEEERHLNTAATDVTANAALVARSTQPAEHPQAAFTGFATASGNKPVQLSAHGQAHAKRMFQEDPSSNVAASTATDGSALAASSTQPAKQQPPAFTGFATGSGNNPVQLSAHGLAHARRIFQAEPPGKTAVSQATDCSAVAASSTDPTKQMQPTFTGFATGSGNKPVQLSANGQAHAKRMFQEERPSKTAVSQATDCSTVVANSTDPPKQPRSSFLGFATGSGNKIVQLSANGQAHAKRMFHEEHPSKTAVSNATDSSAPETSSTQPADLPQSACTGFATGSGNSPVQLSAHGQAHAGHMFQAEPPGKTAVNQATDCSAVAASSTDPTKQMQPTFTGFATGSGSRPVQLSAHGQAHAKQMFQQDPDLQKLGTDVGPCTDATAEVTHHAENAVCTGFKRGANNQSVAISAAKQAHAKHLFDKEQQPERAGTDSAADSVTAERHCFDQQQHQFADKAYRQGIGKRSSEDHKLLSSPASAQPAKLPAVAGTLADITDKWPIKLLRRRLCL